MSLLRGFRILVAASAFAGCGGAPPEIEAPPPDPPPEIDTSGGQTSTAAPATSPTPPATPACASGSWTIDATTRMDVPGLGRYQGAMMIDLTSMQPAPNSTEEPTFPAIWAEPSDPELDLHHMRVTEPADLAGQSGIPRERIRAGLVLSATAESGQSFRIEIASFQGGSRTEARMEVRVSRVDCAP